MRLTIRSVAKADEPWVSSVLIQYWGSTKIVTRGILHDALQLPGLVAETGGEAVGLLLYRLDESMEIVSLNSMMKGRGVGTSLLKEAQKIAVSSGCARMWLVTTNDNVDAIDFYKSRGMKITRIHKGAVTRSRELKPEIPEVGMSGILITDEVEMEKTFE